MHQGSAESHSPDKRDGDFSPAAVDPNDVELGRLGNVHGHLPTALLEPRPSRYASVAAPPSDQVGLQYVLGGLGGQQGEPLPAGKGVGAGLAELTVDLG
jgi:hypothetical protein